MRARLKLVALVAVGCGLAACRGDSGGSSRASGYVEATEVRVAAEVGGRIVEMTAEEGRQVAVGDVLARLDTADVQIALRREHAEHDQAQAQLELLRAGPRVEEIRQARAQAASARADVRAAEAEATAAAEDLQRFEALLASNAGSRKQRDDAAARAAVAQARVQAARERVHAADETVARLQAGARRQELAAAAARVSAVDAQIAQLEKYVTDAVVTSPVAGVITSKLVDAGETIPPRAPVVVISDLNNAWANLYVDEPLVAGLRLGQPVTVIPGGGRTVAGTITFISPQAEFTPRNVQTADERSRLVYRIKVTVDNREGILKPGMPVDAELEPAR